MKKTSNKWIAFNANLPENKENNSPPKSKTVEPKPVTKVVKRSFDFEKQLQPQNLTDLAVHSKKIKEIEQWFEENVLNPRKPKQTASFLLISGPSGCGKTATVKVLCQTHKISLSEWLNPMDQDFELFRGLNQIARFSEFLSESKWKSLFSNQIKKVVLVKEYPNALLRNPADFNSVLEDCYYKGNYPVIFIATSSYGETTNIAQNLFPDEIRVKYQIPEITFNACAPTIMKTALRRAQNLVKDNPDLFKIPSASTVEAIISTSMGDIRSAINQFYFASLLGSSDLPTTSKTVQIKSGSKRKRLQNTSKLDFMLKDEALGLFHGLGRVLNPKFVEIDGRSKLDCDLQPLIDEFSVQPNVFISFLFENYLNYYGDVKDVYEATSLLSFAQSFLDHWTERYDIPVLTLWITVLGLMLYNKHKVSKWNQIRGPTKINRSVANECRKNNLHPTDMFYYNLIVKNRTTVEEDTKGGESSDEYTIE